MKRFLLLTFFIAALAIPGLAQNARYSAPFPSVSSTTATPFLVANVPPNSPLLAVCNSPAVLNASGACVNYATTYTSAGVACSNGAQDTPDPQPSACQSTGDAQGNIGFWAPPGKYDYTVCIQNTRSCSGPYTVTLASTTGTSILLQHNGTTNSSQSILNLESTDSSVGITDLGAGVINLQASGSPDYVDMRLPLNSIPGVACNGSTDDTASIQNYFNFYGKGGAGAAANTRLQLPVGHCRISNQLVYEGTAAQGIRLVGVKGFNLKGTSLDWYGPNFGTMMLMLGCNGCSVEELDYNLNESGNGGGKAQNGLWFDASNTATPATYNISAISRSGNVVTVTTTATHAVTPGRIVKVAGSTGGATSFNGTFQVLYTNSNTTISWLQTGANESGAASTGTVANYQSATSNNLKISHIEVSGHEAVSSTISTITGSGPSYTITTTAAHFVFIGDTVIARGGTDSSYSCPWTVTAVPSSTTLTAVILPGTSCSPSNSNSSGGTLLSGSSGVRIAHVDANTPDVASFHFTDLYIQGDQTGGSINCLEADDGGNVKGFLFENLQFNGCRFGVNGFISGQLTVLYYEGGLNTPDSTPALAAIDFVANAGQIYIQGYEAEGSNYRFFVTTASAGASNVHIDASSFQATAPTDDNVVISAGSLLITSSLFGNNRTAGSAPFIQVNNLLFGTNTASVVSIGNTYTNTAAGCAGPSCGYAPIKDGSGNIWHASAGSFYDGKQVNVTSIGDQGSLTNAFSGNIKPLNFANPNLGVYEAGLQTQDMIYTNTQLLSGGTATHTFPGNFTYTSSSTFHCQCTDQTAAAACSALPASATTVTLGGTGADTLALLCTGH